MEGEPRGHGWLIDIVVGGLVGGIIGAVVAVNVVIFSGIESGYESSIGDIFDYNAFVAALVIVILLAGPVLGVVLARRLRRNRSPSH